MPELPEVEVLRMSLSTSINKKKIIKVEVNNRNLRYKIPRNFEKKLINKKVKKIMRRSKYIIFLLKNNLYMLIHLGMSGVIFLENNKKKIKTSFYYDLNQLEKHNHVKIHFSNKYTLVYNDPRRFGFFKLIENKKNKLDNFFINLGPEPLKKNFNFLYFKNFILNKKKNIKSLLLDQTFLSGLGNIYVNEVLFLSKINPMKSINKLTNYNIKKIINFTKIVLKKSILLGGSSIKNYKNISGKKGLFQEEFKVYGRDNYPCKRQKCDGIIKKIIISNRSSFYCNKCQI